MCDSESDEEGRSMEESNNSQSAREMCRSCRRRVGGRQGVRPSRALSWGLTDENQRDKDTKRESCSPTKEHTSAARPFQTNSHPSVISHPAISQKCFFWLSRRLNPTLSPRPCRRLQFLGCCGGEATMQPRPVVITDDLRVCRLSTQHWNATTANRMVTLGCF